MEMQSLDEMSYWGSIGSLQLEEELFPSESASNNWVPGHELGTKFTNGLACGEKPFDTDLLSGLDDLGDVPDAEFHDWMEMKFDLSEIDVLETLNSLTEKPIEVSSVYNTEFENFSPLDLLSATASKDELPVLPLPAEVPVVTPPNSPQDSLSQIPSSPNSNACSSEFLARLTPPDTPPAAIEVSIYPEVIITVNLNDIVETVPQSESIAAARVSSRRKPYSRGRNATPKAKPVIETKKERKRDQNRDAATRYRLKKRAEVDGLLTEEMALQTKNKELTDQVDNISNEIKYLKNLLKEVFLARAQAKK